jgi:hypothetical protein
MDPNRRDLDTPFLNLLWKRKRSTKATLLRRKRENSDNEDHD